MLQARSTLRLPSTSLMAISLFFAFAASAQDRPSKITISTDPLTTEQIAVYHTVLENHTNLNLADTTQPIEPFLSLDHDCKKEINWARASVSQSSVHRLPEAIAHGLNMFLVNTEEQKKKVEQSDPQKLIKSAIDGHQDISDNQLETSVKTAFDRGLFTLSEIVFDRRRTQALVGYSFMCGELCGSGGILLLQKRGVEWKVKKHCGGWVS